MRPSIKLFIIFHEKIFPRHYKGLELNSDELFFFGVNKQLSPDLKVKSTYEYDLPIYDNLLQKRGYNESSAIYHIYKNDLYKDCDYIGIVQYDMIFGKRLLETIRNSIEKNPEKEIIFYHKKLNFKETREVDTPPVLESYNKFFGTKFTVDDLGKNPINNKIIMYSTFIIPVRVFEKMMSWTSRLIFEIYPSAILPPYPANHNRLGEVMEESYGIFFALESLQKRTTHIEVPIIHSDHKIKRNFFTKYLIYNLKYLGFWITVKKILKEVKKAFLN